MSWYKRDREGILTSTREKKEAPDGLWYKCQDCGLTTPAKELKENLYVCPGPGCGHHVRINATEYFDILFDQGTLKEHFQNLVSADPLHFTDLKPYKERLKEARQKTGLGDAMSVGSGRVLGHNLVVACMNFNFIGGSMGSVVGEKISQAVDLCLKKKYPLLIISKSGGARMMEAAYSLMQMAKTSAKLTLMSAAKLPYISLMTDPTTGGVTASYAMLGDLNIAEPRALIGFAGPRVIKETIKKDLPEGFQTSEFLLEKGFLDFIVSRHDLKQRLADIIRMLSLRTA
jgi:acetyl-CoA carboxylase carboxyl transferase subunit beta